MTKYVCSKTFSRENERQQCLSSDLEFFHHLILFVSRDVEQSYIPSFFYLTSSLLEVSYLVRQYIVKLKCVINLEIRHLFIVSSSVSTLLLYCIGVCRDWRSLLAFDVWSSVRPPHFHSQCLIWKWQKVLREKCDPNYSRNKIIKNLENKLFFFW